MSRFIKIILIVISTLHLPHNSRCLVVYSGVESDSGERGVRGSRAEIPSIGVTFWIQEFFYQENITFIFIKIALDPSLFVKSHKEIYNATKKPSTC